MSGDLGPVQRILSGLDGCSRHEQVVAAHMLMDVIKSWPGSPARTFVTTVTDALMADASDLQDVVRSAVLAYPPTSDGHPAESR